MVGSKHTRSKTTAMAQSATGQSHSSHNSTIEMAATPPHDGIAVNIPQARVVKPPHGPTVGAALQPQGVAAGTSNSSHGPISETAMQPHQLVAATVAS
ncbi:unnamed protein product [Prunus armeniaca]